MPIRNCLRAKRDEEDVKIINLFNHTDMTATIDSNIISITVNNTVEDIDKAMQILITLRSEKRIRAIEDYWAGIWNESQRGKPHFPWLITDTDIRILVVHQTSQRTKEQIVINQLVDRSCMSFKNEEKLSVVEFPSSRESHPHTGRISLKSRLAQFQM